MASMPQKDPDKQRQERNNKAEINRWKLSRRATRSARERLREMGDLNSAELLLRHSIAYGHPRLIVRRYLLACALGLKEPQRYNDYFLSAASELDSGDIATAYNWAQQTAAHWRPRASAASGEGVNSPTLDGRCL